MEAECIRVHPLTISMKLGLPPSRPEDLSPVGEEQTQPLGFDSFSNADVFNSQHLTEACAPIAWYALRLDENRNIPLAEAMGLVGSFTSARG